MLKNTNQQSQCSKINGKKFDGVQEQDSCASNCSAYVYGMVVGAFLFNTAYIVTSSLFHGVEYELTGVDLFNDSVFENVTNISGC
jgi:hypothetical protein